MSGANNGQDGSKLAVPDGFESWSAYSAAKGVP